MNWWREGPSFSRLVSVHKLMLAKHPSRALLMTLCCYEVCPVRPSFGQLSFASYACLAMLTTVHIKKSCAALGTYVLHRESLVAHIYICILRLCRDNGKENGKT